MNLWFTRKHEKLVEVCYWPGHRHEPGDLYLEVKIAPHPLFTRQERDLHYRVSLSRNEITAVTSLGINYLPTIT
ncbi:MAG: hypothetical protein M1438_07820 [Deltaproteobacteria bacterium]|nr:hypothetical protein [Deltaproteobacteria bacterium]